MTYWINAPVWAEYVATDEDTNTIKEIKDDSNN